MATRLIIEGNSVYEIDVECEAERAEHGFGKRQTFGGRSGIRRNEFQGNRDETLGTTKESSKN